MSGNAALDWTILSVSLFNTMLLLWLGLTVLLNADHVPPKPTQGWVTGEIITDPVTLAIPADLPPGEYPIEVGLYDAADPAFTRLPLDNGGTRLILPQPLEVK